MITEKVIPFALTGKAMSQLITLTSQKSEKEHLFIGLKSGGCSGTSYHMEFITPTQDFKKYEYITVNDITICFEHDNLPLLKGLEIDYSDSLINGGFKFKNPNASSTCGCGKSFGV